MAPFFVRLGSLQGFGSGLEFLLRFGFRMSLVGSGEQCLAVLIGWCIIGFLCLGRSKRTVWMELKFRFYKCENSS